MKTDALEGPRSRVDGLTAYERAPVPEGVVLRLDANEGTPVEIETVLRALRDGGGDVLRRYSDKRPLEATLARRFSVQPSQVFVSAGADDVIDRCCRAFLAPNRSLLIAEPGFEMFDHYAALCGGRVRKAPWSPGPYPTARMLELVDDETAVIALVTPNNPTGETATIDDLARLAAAAPHALVILDHAYVEFADADFTADALDLPNVVVVRTFSKAWGLAGCRVGYALGPARITSALRAAGGPFPVSAASLAIVQAVVDEGWSSREAYVSQIRAERRDMLELLARRQASPRRSEANFVFAELGAATPAVHAALVRRGILVRLVANQDRKPLGLRITLPGDPSAFELLTRSMDAVLQEVA